MKITINGIDMEVSLDDDRIIIKPITTLLNWQMFSYSMRKKETAGELFEKFNSISNQFKDITKDEYHGEFKEIEVYDEKTLDEVFDGMKGMFEKVIENNGGCWYNGDAIKVSLQVKYCPENK